TLKRIRFRRAFDRWPNVLRPWPDALLAPDSDRIAAPWPDLVIGAGRASLAFTPRIKTRSGGRTRVVQLQNPRRGLERFDLVIPPVHDGLAGPNVFPIIGSPNRVTPDRLAAAAGAFAGRLDPLPRPRVSVLIGGPSGAYAFSP